MVVHTIVENKEKRRTVTSMHKILTNKGWVLAKDLKKKDVIIGPLQSVKIIKIIKIIK